MATARKDSLVRRWERTKVAEVFGADLRSLAAFRIVLAVIVLADLASRATNLSVHYTDEGVLPREILLDELNIWQVSLNLMNGTIFFQALFFAVAAGAATALLVGYRTRLMAVVVWVMVLSIQWRNPFVLSSADTLLRVLLFWAMFLPLGAYWSIDRARKAEPGRLSMRFLSMATVGLFLQIAFMYWFTVLLKSGREWRVDGTALYYALSAEQLTTPIGAYLLQFPTLLKVLTFAILGVEFVGPFLLFCPVLTGPVRTAAAMAIMSLHAGIWLTMSLGIFPWLGAFCMVCFLPSWFWDKVVPKLRAAVPKQSSIVRRQRPTLAGPAHVSRLPLRAWLSAWGSVGQLSITGMVASAYSNQLGSRATRPTMPLTVQTPPRMGVESTMVRSSLATNLLALFFLGYVFLWNLTTVSAYTMPEHARPLGHLLGLRQNWNMFAPFPIKITDWYIIPGILRDGRQVNLLEPTIYDDPHRFKEEVSWEKPRNIRATFNREERWRKYLGAIGGDSTEETVLYFGKYICRNWNGVHRETQSELETFDIVHFKEKTLPDNRRATPQREVVWEHRCG